MTPYHGTPIGGSNQEAVRFLRGRHAFVSFAAPGQLPIVAEVCQSFAFDNGAFSVWKRGAVLDVPGYLAWCHEWEHHPGFDWALIPDVIEGTAAENDAMLERWTLPRHLGVPVWHLHEPVERLRWLSGLWPRVALGSSGQWPTPGNDSWWDRMAEAMAAVDVGDGRPRCKLHGLRMLDPEIFSRLPLSSADSTNAAQNNCSTRVYQSPNAGTRAAIIAERIECNNSAAAWTPNPQRDLWSLSS